MIFSTSYPENYRLQQLISQSSFTARDTTNIYLAQLVEAGKVKKVETLGGQEVLWIRVD